MDILLEDGGEDGMFLGGGDDGAVQDAEQLAVVPQQGAYVVKILGHLLQLVALQGEVKQRFGVSLG